MKYTILISMMVLILGCTNEISQTTIFANFLFKEFGKDIPNENHVFVVFPSRTGCTGCIDHVFNYIINRKIKNVSLICDEDRAESVPITSGYEILIDSIGGVEHLNLHTQNVAILKTEFGELKKIISIQSDNVDSMLKDCFRL